MEPTKRGEPPLPRGRPSPRRPWWRSLLDGMAGFFFLLGGLLNLVALGMIGTTIFGFNQQIQSGVYVGFDWSQLAPLGIFGLGLLCFMIAYRLD
jgi:hypothetical protein